MERLKTSKTIVAIILSIVILVAAQLLSLFIGELPLYVGMPAAICNIISALLYVVFALLGVKLLCEKYLELKLSEFRIPKFSIKPVWLLSAVIMPALVVLFSIAFGGHWETNTLSKADFFATITGGIFFFGLAAGIVEEVVFRGIIMGCLEKRFNTKVAIIIPSVLFGLVHIIGNNLGFLSIIQLIIAGSIVGILFSLISYESNSIWNSAIVHGLWNIVMIGGILHIGEERDSYSIYNFVLDNNSFLLSGGEFGIESSIISIFAYLIFIIVATILIRRKKEK